MIKKAAAALTVMAVIISLCSCAGRTETVSETDFQTTEEETESEISSGYRPGSELTFECGSVSVKITGYFLSASAQKLYIGMTLTFPTDSGFTSLTSGHTGSCWVTPGYMNIFARSVTYDDVVGKDSARLTADFGQGLAGTTNCRNYATDSAAGTASYILSFDAQRSWFASAMITVVLADGFNVRYSDSDQTSPLSADTIGFTLDADGSVIPAFAQVGDPDGDTAGSLMLTPYDLHIYIPSAQGIDESAGNAVKVYMDDGSTAGGLVAAQSFEDGYDLEYVFSAPVDVSRVAYIEAAGYTVNI